MRRIGAVVGAAQGLVICRSPDEGAPRVGTRVVDDSLSAVGDVVEVFGPVEQPYVAVTPTASVHPPELVGDPVYAENGE